MGREVAEKLPFFFVLSRNVKQKRQNVKQKRQAETSKRQAETSSRKLKSISFTNSRIEIKQIQKVLNYRESSQRVAFFFFVLSRKLKKTLGRKQKYLSACIELSSAETSEACWKWSKFH